MAKLTNAEVREILKDLENYGSCETSSGKLWRALVGAALVILGFLVLLGRV